jgi:site-specific recombinase XerD
LDEIVNLRWKNVDLNGRIITVGDEEFTTKGRTQRFIPISEEAYEALLRVKNPSVRLRINSEQRVKSKNIYNLSLGSARDFVFCKENGKMFTGNYFSRRFKDACKSADMDNKIHFHTLRHSFASNLAQKGVSLYTIKELLGHSSISTTEIYSHLNMDCLREAVNKLDTGDKILDTEEKQKNELKIFRINSRENK